MLHPLQPKLWIRNVLDSVPVLSWIQKSSICFRILDPTILTFNFGYGLLKLLYCKHLTLVDHWMTGQQFHHRFQKDDVHSVLTKSCTRQHSFLSPRYCQQSVCIPSYTYGHMCVYEHMNILVSTPT
jgi:hypothetical protein